MIINKKKFIFFILIISLKGFSQPGASWQLQLLAGESLIDKAGRIKPETHNFGFSIDYSKKTNGKRYWHYANNFPQAGLHLTFKNLGNDSIYGHAVSLMPYLEFNVLTHKLGIFQIKHGAGIAYITKTHSDIYNPRNRLVSTHLNASFILDLGYRFFISNKLDIKPGVVLHHMSNGGFKLPNRGVNTAFAYISISYYPSGKKIEITDHEKEKNFPRFRYRVGTAFGFYNHRKGRDMDVNPQFLAMVFYQHNSVFRSGLGMEVGTPANSPTQLSYYVEEEVQFAHLITRYGFGAYILNKRISGEDFYSKIGMGYYPKIKNKIPQGLYIAAHLKAHVFTAAHIELSTGYTF
ncbi:MAG: acyloxyacyl hydrolase [Bacteroidetes bacterium]|nr:acyloxyacyl hydrolase [Bacteroidota bacterium]